VRSATAQGLFDLSRGRQALLSVAQPALGAVLALGKIPDSRTMFLGLVAATSGYLAVFSLNDVLDLRSDVQAMEVGKGEWEGFDLDAAFSRHPVAAGKLRLGLALLWVLLLAVTAVVFAWLLNPLCVLVFASSVCLEAVYCALRRRTWAKTLVSGVMVGLGGLAGWVAVAPLDARAFAFFAFLAVWEIAGRNLPNDLADLDADRAVRLRTVATTFGPEASGRAIAVGAVVTVGIVPLMPLGFLEAWGSIVAAIGLMAFPALILLVAPTPAVAGRYFNRASLLPAVVFVIVLACLSLRGAL